MLSRRQLRIKVLQALYAFYQSEKTDLAIGDRDLLRSIDKVYELYLFLLLLLKEIGEADLQDAEEAHQKHFPKEEELKARHRIHQLSFITVLSSNDSFLKEVKNRKLSWQKDHELVRKIFLEIKKSDDFKNFLMNKAEVTEKDFLTGMMKNHIETSEALKNFIEENNIYWMEDFGFICHVIIKMIKDFYANGKIELIPVYKDEDDKNFVRELFSKTILHDKEYEEAISSKTQNWEVERIALIDMILLKMSMAELITFPGIPVKVSINEYIDISKDYSTPKSRQFINGIIDKLADEYKKSGKIVKTGRGLIG
jgi:N utilization substance protein B